MNKERVEAFSDAVFAVALTILVLSLTVPQVANHSSFATYATALSPIIPKFLVFVLSFLIIAIHWVSHHYFFTRLKSTPLAMVWLNNLLLLGICVMPFTTALLGEHWTDSFPIVVYGVNQLLVAFTFLFFRIYATSNKLFVDEKTAKENGPRHSLPAIVLFTIATLIAFVNTYLSIAFFTLDLVIYFVPNFIEKKKR